MSTRVQAALAVAVAVAVLPAAPAAACEVSGMTRSSWLLDSHAEGMPTTDRPARTLVEGRVAVESASRDEVLASVTLGAEPDADSAAVLTVVLGAADDSGDCRPVWEVATSTRDPGEGVRRDGAVLTLEQEVGFEAWSVDCAVLTISDGIDRAVHDRMVDLQPVSAVADPPAALHAEVTDQKRVVVDRWESLRVRLSLRCDVARVRISGRGAGVSVRPRQVRTPADGETVRVRLPVRLQVDRRRFLTVTVMARGEDGDRLDRQRARVLVRPRR